MRHVTHARPFGLLCSRPASTYVKPANRTLMLAVQQGHICICQACRTQRHVNSIEYVGQLRYVRSIKPYGRTFQAVHTSVEYLCLALLRDHLISHATVVYPILASFKMSELWQH